MSERWVFKSCSVIHHPFWGTFMVFRSLRTFLKRQKPAQCPLSWMMSNQVFFWDSEHADAEGDGSRKMFAGRQQGSKIDKRIENRAFETILFSNIDSIGLLWIYAKDMAAEAWKLVKQDASEVLPAAVKHPFTVWATSSEGAGIWQNRFHSWIGEIKLQLMACWSLWIGHVLQNVWKIKISFSCVFQIQ